MQHKISLTAEQQVALENLLLHANKPYLRERAAAILKVARGQSGVQVAQEGLLKKRRKNTVYDWIYRYQSEGVEGLLIKKGRGRKASFSPSI